jgi:hypothetical protein
MSVQTTCPSCHKPVSIPEECFGSRVQCPICNSIFTAKIDPVPPVRPVDEPATDEPRPVRQPRYGRDYGTASDPDRPSVGRAQPHRGGVVLTLGILSLVVSCFPLGIVAWVMGNNDLEAMRRGRMDPSGEGLTVAGKVCGIISVVPIMIAGVCAAVAVIGKVIGAIFF